MNILMHIYVAYIILNNIFAHLDKISKNVTRGVTK
jgi:hypothetical protein